MDSIHTDLSRRIVDAIEPLLNGQSYSEVLQALDVVSAKIYLSAPNNTADEALQISHRSQELMLAHLLNEEAKAKGILDSAIGRFHQFSRGAQDVLDPRDDKQAGSN